MPKKKIAKWHRDIANSQAISAQAISGTGPIDRCEWWQRLARASTQEQITEVVHTPMLPDITDEDTEKPVEK